MTYRQSLERVGLNVDFSALLLGAVRKVLILKDEICRVFRTKELRSLALLVRLLSQHRSCLSRCRLHEIVKDQAPIRVPPYRHQGADRSVSPIRYTLDPDNSILRYGVKRHRLADEFLV